MVPSVLIAACGALAACATAPAQADPARPDFGRYTEDDTGDYTRCSGPQPHCLVSFKSSDGPDGYQCYVVISNKYAHCVSIRSENGQEAALNASGQPTISRTKESDHQEQAENTPVLPSLYKLSFRESGVEKIACGTGDDGSVSCQNAQGHGFVLSPDGNNTW